MKSKVNPYYAKTLNYIMNLEIIFLVVNVICSCGRQFLASVACKLYNNNCGPNGFGGNISIL